ncbi:MAG: hypothetical protein AAB791_00755, partial [Patescibacteria group bacterium]
MGEIMEAGYPTAKALVQIKSAVTNAKFFKEVDKLFGKASAAEGFAKLPDARRLGSLAGKHVPKPIFDALNEIIRPRDATIAKQLVAGFKFGKVILNPATHARNIGSNFVLNSFEGMTPINPKTYSSYFDATKELAKPGKWLKEAKDAGLGMDTFAAREIKDLLLEPSAGFVSKLGSKAKETAEKLANFYQKEEEFAKLAQFIFQRKSGKTTEEAWKVAERATFNYAQVTPFIRQLRESLFGFPFITFTYKATPQVAKTLVTHPTRISNIGKLKQAIESQADLKELEKERSVEPDYIRDGFYIKLPVKDKLGRSAYFDLTYVLPFGDLISGQLIERGIYRETGLPEALPGAGLRKTPALNLIRELDTNQDFYGNKVVKESDAIEKQLGDVFRHVTKTYLPPLL